MERYITQDGIVYKVIDDIIRGWVGVSPFQKPILNETFDTLIEGWTQEDEDADAERQEEEEADVIMRGHIEKGVRLQARSYRKVWRKVVKKEQLTKAKGRKLFRWLKPTWEDLKNGDFRQSYKSISDVLIDNDVALQNEPVMLGILEWLKDLIMDYRNNKYDL